MSEKLKILLADDEALLRLDLREMLTEAGHNVVDEAADGKSAVELARKLRPDCVLMDVKMPVMDGLAAARLIAEEKIAPVILLTAYSQQDIVKQAQSAGVIGYLVKPVREEQLLTELAVAVSRFQELRQLNDELEDLKESLATRKLLDRAKGILMSRHNLSEAEAYRKMQQFSMAKRIPLKELAQSILAAADK